MSALSFFAWLISGPASFVFWWTKEHDFTLKYVPMAILTSVLGPVTFVIGWIVHGDPIWSGDAVIFRKRK